MPRQDGAGPAKTDNCTRRRLGRGTERKFGRGLGACNIDFKCLKNSSKLDMIESLKNRIAILEEEITKSEEN